MQPLISVIVPIYKVEKYLDRCVQSIVDQMYKNLEIIMVDDGSPDSCPVMCDAWAEKDSRIKVVHKENGGLSDARNAGMALATGELMGFIDSDDWIEPNMYELLYQHLKEDEADIAACGVQMEWEDGSNPTQMLTHEGNCVLTRDEAMQAIIEESWLKQPVCYKLYKTELIQDIPFAIGKCHEDVFWSYQAIGATRRVSVCDIPCYHYIQRSGSIMGTEFSEKRLDIIRAKQERQKYLEAFWPELELYGRKDLLFSCIYQGQMFEKGRESDVKENSLRFLRKIAEDIKFSWKEIKKVSIKELIWIVMVKTSFQATCRLRNKLKIGN